jgi:hypothetical protein
MSIYILSSDQKITEAGRSFPFGVSPAPFSGSSASLSNYLRQVGAPRVALIQRAHAVRPHVAERHRGERAVTGHARAKLLNPSWRCVAVTRGRLPCLRSPFPSIRLMSAKGQSRTFGPVVSMSELPSTADIARTCREVPFVPIAASAVQMSELSASAQQANNSI